MRESAATAERGAEYPQTSLGFYHPAIIGDAAGKRARRAIPLHANCVDPPFAICFRLSRGNSRCAPMAAGRPSSLGRGVARGVAISRTPRTAPVRHGKEACMTDRPAGPRCAALVGPYLSAKTTLLEALLFASGTTHRRGTAKEGNTVGDHAPEARARQMSTELNVAAATFLGDPCTFLDCPGSVELAWDAQSALLAADLASPVLQTEINPRLPFRPALTFPDDPQIPHPVLLN